MFTSFYGLAMASLVFLVGSCLSQDKGGVDQTVALPVLEKIFSSGQLSGSLEYWGLCDGSKPRSEFPKLRSVSGHEGSPRDILQELFADDTKMRVTQESDGKIRMVEADVPKDFLEVKIHHLSFPSDYHSGSMALYAIVNTRGNRLHGPQHWTKGRLGGLGLAWPDCHGRAERARRVEQCDCGAGTGSCVADVSRVLVVSELSQPR
jgi:hypothetical protein